MKKLIITIALIIMLHQIVIYFGNTQFEQAISLATEIKNRFEIAAIIEDIEYNLEIRNSFSE